MPSGDTLSNAGPLALRFVTGAATIAELTEQGVVADFAADGVRLDVHVNLPVIEPTHAQLAAGFLATSSRGAAALQRWAQLVLALDSIDLAKLEDTPRGDELLEAIWDAAAGDPRGIDVATRWAVE